MGHEARRNMKYTCARWTKCDSRMEVGVEAGLVIGEGVALQTQVNPTLNQSTRFMSQDFVPSIVWRTSTCTS